MIGALLCGTAELLVICTGALLAAAWAAGATSRDASTNELAADIALIATAIAIGVSSWLLLARIANPFSIAASFAVLGALALGFEREASLARLTRCVRAGLRALACSRLLWLLPLFALVVVARGLALPQLSWDGLTYHLTYPAVWIQHGGITRFEAGGVFEAYETFPKGGETLFYLAMLPFHADTLVNLVNLPLWLGLAIAVRACAQRLGVRRSLQDGCAVTLGLCPVFSAYVTAAYVEVATALAFAAAISAGLRVLAGESRATWLLGVALGTAVAVKLTALSLVPFGLLVVLYGARRAPRPHPRSVLGALALAALVGAPFYLRSAVVCGNPLYPAPLPGFSQGAAAGSIALRFTLEQSSVLSQAAIGRVFESLSAAPWQGYPLGPANLYPLALALPWLLLFFGDPRQRRAGCLLVALALCQACVYLVSPWNGIYVGANTRFLGPSLIAAGLASSIALEAAPRAQRRCLGPLALACSLAYLARAPVVREPVPCLGSLLCALALGLSLAAATRSATLPPERSRTYLGVSALCLLAAIAAAPLAFEWRQRHRLASYLHAVDLHPLPTPSKELWPLVASLPASRIAFSVAGIDAGEGWFFYPLFGADLRHAVRYVDVQADGELTSCARRGLTRNRPDFTAWQQRLRAQHIDYLATHGAPLEAEWAEAHPEMFARVATLPASKLFRILPPAARPSARRSAGSAGTTAR